MDENDIEVEYEHEIKSLRIKYIILLIIVAIIAAVFSSEYTMYNLRKQYSLIEKGEYSEEANSNIDSIARTLKGFRKIIDSKYIGDIDEQKMFDEALKGYINGLGDEYSEYMTKEEWEDFEAGALGNYVGIGIYMGVDKNSNVVVLATIKDTPAEQAGLKEGDISR